MPAAVAPPSPQSPIASPAPASNQSSSASASSTAEPEHIKPVTNAEYQKLVAEARHYEMRYTTVVAPRKTQLAGPLKAIMNKLREETFQILTDELGNFLNGQEQQMLGQSIRISSEEGKRLFGTTKSFLVSSAA